MKAIALVIACSLSTVALADKPVASGPLKAYVGPEGETVAVVPTSEGKEVLVYFRGLGSDLDGKTLRYTFEDLGNDRQQVYVMKKRGSKSYRSIMLTDYSRGGWLFVHPLKTSTQFRIRYSRAASVELKVDEVINAYKP